MNNQEEILEFIKRRFPVDCNWCTGNCYWFARILCERFDLKLYYNPIEGHFVAGRVFDYYDWHGLYETNEPLILADEIKKTDPGWWSRIEEGCIK